MAKAMSRAPQGRLLFPRTAHAGFIAQDVIGTIGAGIAARRRPGQQETHGKGHEQSAPGSFAISADCTCWVHLAFSPPLYRLFGVASANKRECMRPASSPSRGCCRFSGLPSSCESQELREEKVENRSLRRHKATYLQYDVAQRHSKKCRRAMRPLPGRGQIPPAA